MSYHVQRSTFNFQRPTEKVFGRPLLPDEFVIRHDFLLVNLQRRH